jgi:hypothetical protein
MTIIILNSEFLDNLIKDDTLKILKKNQRVLGNCNYYYNPSIGINLYKPKVKFLDKKFMVFEFEKYNHLALLGLLKHINTVLKNITKNKFSELFDKNIYDLFNEDDEKFMIRCYLPNYNGKYSIETDYGKFNLPRIGCCYDMATIEFRNIWKNGEKYGFNIELKRIVTDSVKCLK